jgi:folate-binding protein YgfZ
MLMDSKWQALMGFAPLPSTGIIAVKGIDAKTFLQGQLTVNIDKVTLNQSQLGAHCNLKGRMQALFRIINIQKSEQEEPAYLLLLPKSLLADALKNLKKYAIFSKVTLTEMQDFSAFGIIGEQAAEHLAIDPLPIGGSLISKTDWIIYRSPGNELRYTAIVPTAKVADFQQSMQKELPPLKEEVWELLEIDAGIPTIYPATIDALLPHHVNLTALAGISFDKGCYLGQEIIARMHYKGKIKRHMYRAQLAETVEAPSPGDHIVIVDAPNEAPGIVVRAAKNDEGFQLLVVLDEQYADFENIRFKKADGPKLHRLNLAY